MENKLWGTLKTKALNIHLIPKTSIIEFLVLFFILIFAIIIRINGLDFYSDDADSFYIYTYSTAIFNYNNPYLRILDSDMIHNQKYATSPPLYFYLGMIPLYFGYSSYPSWIFFMKIFFLIPVDFGVAILIYIILKQSANNSWFRITAVFIWLVNRWGLYVYTYALIDTFTIFFILLSLYYFYSRPEVSSLLLGIAIATKLFPIFLLPFYLISHHQKGVYKLLKYVFFALIPLFLVSLPFIVLSIPEAYFKSLLFSATRQGDSSMKIVGPELMPFFGEEGVDTRIPLLISYLVLYLIHWKKVFNTYMFTTTGLLIWNLMNANVYAQYWVWFIPFALILIGKIIDTGALSNPVMQI